MPAGLVPEYDKSNNTIKSGDYTGTVKYNELTKSYRTKSRSNSKNRT